MPPGEGRAGEMTVVMMRERKGGSMCMSTYANSLIHPPIHFSTHSLNKHVSKLYPLCQTLQIRRSSFFFFLAVSHGILVTPPGIKPVPRAMEAWSLNHWTARGVPQT